jgi:5-methylthioribose kinase
MTPRGTYRALGDADVAPYLAGLAGMGQRLGGDPDAWQVRNVADGNLNNVWLVAGATGTVCVKQALPYVRVAGEGWPMPVERTYFEHAYWTQIAPIAGSLAPAIHHYDPDLFLIVMEALVPHIILRQGLIAGRRYDGAAAAVAGHIARTAFHTSDLMLPLERKLPLVALFSANQALLRITVDLVFTEPYQAAPRNRHTSPQLDALAAELRADLALKAAVARLRRRFLSSTEALLHGDLHTGSVMVTQADTRVIDPEFACYGPVAFDLGAFLANLLIAWFAQPGHTTPDDDRRRYQDWLLRQIAVFWERFRTDYLALWTAPGPHGGDAYPPGHFADAAVLAQEGERIVAAWFADMLGFAAIKIIRRIFGFAHVADFETIPDPDRRASCEAGAVALARLLLTAPERFPDIASLLACDPLRNEGHGLTRPVT